jgi:hypothetical protein
MKPIRRWRDANNFDPYKRLAAFILKPTNVYVEYLGIDPDVIRDYVMLRGKEAEDWPAELLAKEMD